MPMLDLALVTELYIIPLSDNDDLMTNMQTHVEGPEKCADALIHFLQNNAGKRAFVQLFPENGLNNCLVKNKDGTLSIFARRTAL